MPAVSNFQELPGHFTRTVPEAFPYTIEIDTSQVVPVDAEGALIAASFRHFYPSDINVGASSSAGALNVGYRLYSDTDDASTFEDRAIFQRILAEPSEWLVCSIKIPRERIDFGKRYKIFVDLVFEEMFWFSDRGETGFIFPLDLRDSDEANRYSISRMHAPMLEDSLINAFSRIAELEHAERQLIAERDEYRARLAVLSERMSRDVESFAALPPPATQISDMLRSLDPVQRRDVWLNAISALGAQGAIFGLYPHDGQPGPLRILVHGSGGFGDMIYLGVVIRELQEHFADSEIFVLHENRNVDAVFDNNPRVSAGLSLQADKLRQFLHLANRLDIFDLVAEVRYAVTYAAPPLSRVPLSFQLRANASSAEWQKYVRYDWPHMNHLFANTVIARGLGKLDLVGLTALLPITRHSDVDLFIPANQMVQFPALAATAYVTIHHGSDRNMASIRGLQTKNMTTGMWADIVESVKTQGLQVVQLGDEHEDLVVGVDVDLRGRTSFLQSAYVIKTARAHLDTEGGLVHVARAVNTRSVVMFGPTPAAFFAYPQNDNVSPRLCGNCWWVTRRWAAECPRGLVVPECMQSHDPVDIASRAVRIARSESRLAVELVESFVVSPSIRAALRGAAVPAGKGLILLGAEQDLQEVAELVTEHYPLAILLIATETFRSALTALHETLRIQPYSEGNIPLASGRYPWAIGLGLDLRNPNGISLALDLQRCVVGDGPCYLLGTNKGQPLPTRDWLDHIADAAAQLQGGGFSLVLPDAGDPAMREARKIVALLLRLASAPEPERVADRAS